MTKIEEEEVQAKLGQLAERAARLLSQGQSREAVVREFVGYGFAETLSTSIVERVHQALVNRVGEQEKAQKSADAKATMTWGAGLCALGLVITFGTHAMASGGGTYVITGGLIIGGAWMFLKGLFRSM